MKKNYSFVAIFALLLLVSFTSYSQAKLNGKVFSTLYSKSSVKKKYGGVCMVYTYCSLEFDKTTVTVSFHTEADCSLDLIEKEPEKIPEKTYEWYAVKKAIHIKDFKEFDPLGYADGKLFGKRSSSGKTVDIEFSQEP